MNYNDFTPTRLLYTLETAGQLPPLDLIRAFLARRAELAPAVLALFGKSIHDDWPVGDPRRYRVVHAGRLLLAYRQEAALPIFEELYRQGGDIVDWFTTAPAIYGAPAIPTFQRVLQMDTQGQYHYGRSMSTEVLHNMAVLYPETRDAVIQVLRSLLPPLTESGELDWPRDDPEDIWSPAAFYLAALQDEASEGQIKALLARGWLDPEDLDESSYAALMSGDESEALLVKPFDIITTYKRLHIEAERRRLLEENTITASSSMGSTAPLRHKSGEKIKRNEPCPCGSGKKFKKCHGRPGFY